MPARLLLTLTASVAVATPVLLTGGGAALAQDETDQAVRAVGSTLLGTSATASSATAFCVTAGTNARAECSIKATATIKVSAATQKKFKLPSTTVATGAYKKAGEDGVFKLTATAATRTKLKASKGKLLPVTYQLKYTSPITETVSKKADLRIGSGAVKQLVLRSDGDTTTTSRGRG